MISLQSRINNLSVIVQSRERQIFVGETSSLTSVNDKGIFDVLPQHENFISLIKQYLILHKLDGNDQKIPLERGILKVESNKVEIYLVSISNAS